MRHLRNTILCIMLCALTLLLSVPTFAQTPATFDRSSTEIARALTLAAYESGVLEIEEGQGIVDAGSELGEAFVHIYARLERGGGNRISLDLALALLAQNGEIQFQIESPGQIAEMYNAIVEQCDC